MTWNWKEGKGGGGSVYRKDSCITGAERGVFDDAEGLKHVPPAAASGFWRWQLLRVSMAVRGGEDGDGNKGDACRAAQPDLLLLFHRHAAHKPLVACRCNVGESNVLLHAFFPEFPAAIQQAQTPNPKPQTPNLLQLGHLGAGCCSS